MLDMHSTEDGDVIQMSKYDGNVFRLAAEIELFLGYVNLKYELLERYAKEHEQHECKYVVKQVGDARLEYDDSSLNSTDMSPLFISFSPKDRHIYGFEIYKAEGETVMGVFFEDGKVLTDHVFMHPSEQEYGKEIQRYVTVFDDMGDPDKAYENFKEFKDAANALIDEISQSVWP